MKYFYKDPLAAAWMAKHFGMQFMDCAGFSVSANPAMADMSERHGLSEAFYIHPDSVNLLEPQFRDIVRGHDDEVGTTIHLYGFHSSSWTLERIMERNDIAFMWPESEE